MNRQCDVVIVGSGIAGLYTALLLDPSLKVIVLTKKKIEDCNSYLAQGGIAAAIDKENDTFEAYANDTIRAGAGICDREALRVMIGESEENIKMLQEFGAVFDHNKEGLSLTREAGHSHSRILHIDGDATGKGIMDVLIKKARNQSNIEIRENSFCLDLIKDDKRCLGVVALEEDITCYYLAGAVVLAAGGVGMIYGVTTNVCTITGDAIAMAKRAGVVIEDMEFVQFHPTVFHNQENKRFLISEAVRGEGAVLRNIRGERFMQHYDKRQELAPRDIVARAIITEMKRTQAEHVFLDLTHMDKEYVLRRFPNISAKCKEYGIDITKQMIPVSPAQHYLMGGIKTDLWGRTSLPGLYACGENACTGVHGANRLASNSLLEGLVFAKRSALMINKSLPSEKISFADIKEKNKALYLAKECNVEDERNKIQKIMRNYSGIIRSKYGLNKGSQELTKIEKSLQKKKCLSVGYIECCNILTVAKLIAEHAMKRKASIGAHYLSEGVETLPEAKG